MFVFRNMGLPAYPLLPPTIPKPPRLPPPLSSSLLRPSLISKMFHEPVDTRRTTLLPTPRLSSLHGILHPATLPYHPFNQLFQPGTDRAALMALLAALRTPHCGLSELLQVVDLFLGKSPAVFWASWMTVRSYISLVFLLQELISSLHYSCSRRPSLAKLLVRRSNLN